MEWGNAFSKNEQNDIKPEINEKGIEIKENKTKEKFRLFYKREITFVLIGLFIISLLIIYVTLVPITREYNVSNDSDLSKNLKTFEEKIAKIDSFEKKVNDINGTYDKILSINSNLERLEANLLLKLNSINSKLKEIRSTKENLNIGNSKTTIIEKSLDEKKNNKLNEIQSNKKSVTDTSETESVYHVMKKGETFYRISRKYKITLDHLRKINESPKNAVIYPRKKLLIKDKKF